jgi:hypothetical protein
VVAGTSDGSSSRDNGRCPITMTTVEGA